MPEITLTANKTAMMAKNNSVSGWNGYDEHLQVGFDGAYKWRSLCKFNIDTAGWGTVTSAVLRLTQYSTASPHAVQSGANLTDLRVARATMDWGKGIIVPGEAAATTQEDWSWDTRQDKWDSYVVEEDIDQTSSGTELDIDVTAIVNSWFNGAYNYGFMLINATNEADDDFALLFYSDNHATTGNHPELIINYTLNQAPNVPVDLQPADTVFVDTLVPQFSWQFSDPDANDYMSAFRIDVEDVEEGTVWESGWVTTDGNPVFGSIAYGAENATDEDEAEPLIPGHTYDWYLWVKDRQGAVSPDMAVPFQFVVNSPPDEPDIQVTPPPTADVPTNFPTISFAHNDPDPDDSLMYGFSLLVEENVDGIWYPKWESGDVDLSSSPYASGYLEVGAALDWGVLHRFTGRTLDSHGAWSEYADWEEFTTHKAATPGNMFPGYGATASVVPSFSGYKGSDYDTITSYWLRVYSLDLQTEMLAATEYTSGITYGTWFSNLYSGAALTPGVSYQWQAKIVSDIGGESEWSALIPFTVQDFFAPSVVEPVGDNGYDTTPDVEYTSADVFDAIQLELYTEGSSLVDDTGTITSGITGSGPTTYAASWPMVTLNWSQGYKIRARVSDDGGSVWSAWSAMEWFKTDSTAVPVLVNISGDTRSPAWVDNVAAPQFEFNSGGGGSMEDFQIQLWDAIGNNLIFEGEWDAAPSGSSYTYDWFDFNDTYPPGFYMWTVRYRKATGAVSPFATKKSFKVQNPPYIPTDLFPVPGYVGDGSEDTIFMARFFDEDVLYFNDFAQSWEGDIDLLAGGDVTSFVNPANGNGLSTTDISLATGEDYVWRTRFKDSLDHWGPWSGWQQFRVATAPDVAIITPSHGSVLTTTRPIVTWTFSGGTQESYKIRIQKISGINGDVVDFVAVAGPYYGEDVSVKLPGGFLKDKKFYRLTLIVTNEEELQDPDAPSVDIEISLDAPHAITGVDAIANERRSRVKLTWNQTTLKTNHSFLSYRIYRRRPGLDDWYVIGNVKKRADTTFTDWYAGNGVVYDYKVAGVTTKSGGEVELESPDAVGGGSFATTAINNDNWTLVGEDRNPSHIANLIIIDEDHNRPIQQEVFETLGASRKVIMRGFVLGHEGSITTLWVNTDVESPYDSQSTINETLLGRQLVDYITRKAGPHILKSPFGDVWDVQISDPEYRYQPVGHLEISFEWIETGNTSRHI